MSNDTSDLIDGVLYLLPVLILLFAASRVLAAFTHARFARAMRPLLPLVSGQLGRDGVGGLMVGTYLARKISVRAISGARNQQFSGHPNQKRNLWTVEMDSPPGEADWVLDYRGLRVSTGQPSLTTKPEETALIDRLTAAGLLTQAERLGGELVLRHSARAHSISLLEDLRPALAPTPQRFQQQLDLLSDAMRINMKVNPPPSATA